MSILHSNIIGSGDQHFIILHGFLGMGDNWKTQAKNLAKKDYSVHLVDQRNHGRSFWSEAFNYNMMVGDLQLYLDHHDLKEVILLGHSMGGKTAMGFALKYPDRVKKLIIADIGPKYYAPHHQEILAGLSTLNFIEINSRKKAAEHLENYIPNMGTRQFLLKNIYWVSDDQLGLRPNIEVLKNAGEAIGEPIESESSFLKPVLFLYGGNSNYINSNTDSLMILNLFPKAEVTKIENSGHWLHVEQPQQFFEILIKWLT